MGASRNGRVRGFGSVTGSCTGRWMGRVALGLALATLGATSAGAAVQLVGVNEATLRWSPASGPVDGYVVFVARDRGPLQASRVVADEHVTLSVAPGDSITVAVRAFGPGADGTTVMGPESEPSETISVEAPPVFETSGLWTLHCVECGTLQLRELSDAAPLAEVVAFALPWVFEGYARLGRAAVRAIWWEPSHGTLVLQDLSSSPPRSGPAAVGSAVEGHVFDAAADFDGDGVDELVLHDYRTRVVEIWRVTNRSLAVARTFSGPPGADVAGAADVTGDGRADMIWLDPTTGSVVVASLEDLAPTNGRVLGTTAKPSRLADVADYDGDGLNDLLWRANDGSLSVWYLGRGSLRRVANLPFVPGDDLRQVVASADFDRTPGAEIALQQLGTGAIDIVFPRSETAPARVLALTPGSRWTAMDATN